MSGSGSDSDLDFDEDNQMEDIRLAREASMRKNVEQTTAVKAAAPVVVGLALPQLAHLNRLEKVHSFIEDELEEKEELKRAAEKKRMENLQSLRIQQEKQFTDFSDDSDDSMELAKRKISNDSSMNQNSHASHSSVGVQHKITKQKINSSPAGKQTAKSRVSAATTGQNPTSGRRERQPTAVGSNEGSNASMLKKRKGVSQQQSQSPLKNPQSGVSSTGPSSFIPVKAPESEETKARVNDAKRDVQVGYENKEAYTSLTRSHLETKDLRNFHNWIKSVVIKKYSDECKQNIKKREDLPTTSNQLYVMEIACGSGGDLKKWMHAEIALYLGVDISYNQLKEASKRAKSIIDLQRPEKKFKFGLYQKDGTHDSETFWKHIHDPKNDADPGKRFFFDIVSCQMAMHYMFGSEQNARNFFQNATSRLNNFGYLILTFSDANAIVKKMRSRGKVDSEGKHVFSNKYFSMQFDSLQFPTDSPYGMKYGFYLQEAVGEKDPVNGQIKYTPEYLVELNNLMKLGLEYSLDVKENLNFIEFYKQYRYQHKQLFVQMRLDKFEEGHEKIDDDFWDISHCYRVVVFQKIDPSVDPNDAKNKKYHFHRSRNLKYLHPEPIPSGYIQPPRNNTSRMHNKYQ